MSLDQLGHIGIVGSLDHANALGRLLVFQMDLVRVFENLGEQRIPHVDWLPLFHPLGHRCDMFLDLRGDFRFVGFGQRFDAVLGVLDLAGSLRGPAAGHGRRRDQPRTVHRGLHPARAIPMGPGCRPASLKADSMDLWPNLGHRPVQPRADRPEPSPGGRRPATITAHDRNRLDRRFIPCSLLKTFSPNGRVGLVSPGITPQRSAELRGDGKFLTGIVSNRRLGWGQLQPGRPRENGLASSGVQNTACSISHR